MAVHLLFTLGKKKKKNKKKNIITTTKTQQKQVSDKVMVFNATFNNISVISWRSV